MDVSRNKGNKEDGSKTLNILKEESVTKLGEEYTLRMFVIPPTSQNAEDQDIGYKTIIFPII
jgi:hypothetical protein